MPMDDEIKRRVSDAAYGALVEKQGNFVIAFKNLETALTAFESFFSERVFANERFALREAFLKEGAKMEQEIREMERALVKWRIGK